MESSSLQAGKHLMFGQGTKGWNLVCGESQPRCFFESLIQTTWQRLRPPLEIKKRRLSGSFHHRLKLSIFIAVAKGYSEPGQFVQ